MEDTFTEQILNELKQIRRFLTVLSQDKLENFNGEIQSKYLTTPQRHQMYDMFDGVNTYQTIADTVKYSKEAVRLFAVQLERAGIVEIISNGQNKYPKKLF